MRERKTKRGCFLSIFFVSITLQCKIAEAFVFNTSSASCGIASIPPSPQLPNCTGNASATLDEAIARAHLYAPVVRFHMLEANYLQARNLTRS